MRDITINEKFVCKKYDPDQKEFEEEFYKRFVDEIKIMYSVYNNNIIRIFDYFLYPEIKTGFIIMEYIEGRNIDEYFQVEEGEHINSVFVQIINAFAYLEKNKILHRDVRAENVLIDDSGTVKIIDFGFGKKLNADMPGDQASILLNWPASQIPSEIWREVYNVKTEIYYVGYLIKNLIEKYNIDCFKYSRLLEKMVIVNSSERIESFELIKKVIAEQAFENIEFKDWEKVVYQKFATDFCNALCEIENSLVVERDTSVIIEKLRVVIKDNVLEEFITHNEKLISCFVKSAYSYYKTEIPVVNLKNFYVFFAKQQNEKKDIILNNLYGRLSNIPVVKSELDEELPFD